jgi:hypothetical protein
MSASHTYNNNNDKNNDISDGMDVSTDWKEGITPGVELEMDADCGYSGYAMAHDDSDYLDDYGSTTMNHSVNAYDTKHYSYHLADRATAGTGKGGSTSNTDTTVPMTDNAASFSHDSKYLEDYVPNQEYPDHQDAETQENGETQVGLDTQTTTYYGDDAEEGEGEDEDDDDDELDEELNTDRQNTAEGGDTVENPIVQEIRANIDDTHAKIRSWTNKLLQEMELYVKTLVETEKTYNIIQQQELAESERLDQCEADVTRAISAFNFQNTHDDDEEVYEDDTMDSHNAQEDFQDNETE